MRVRGAHLDAGSLAVEKAGYCVREAWRMLAVHVDDFREIN